MAVPGAVAGTGAGDASNCVPPIGNTPTTLMGEPCVNVVVVAVMVMRGGLLEVP